jgi:hypothetical protein
MHNFCVHELFLYFMKFLALDDGPESLRLNAVFKP